MNLNKTQLIGRITRDPELKALSSGTNVCSFSLATNRFFTQNGEKKETTEFHNCVAWGKTADVVAQYVKKGSLLYVEGRLETKSWDDKNTGEKKYRTEIIVENVQLPPKGMSGASSTPVSRKSAEEQEADKRFDGDDVPQDDIDPADIPFN